MSAQLFSEHTTNLWDVFGEARVRGDILHRTEDSSLDYDSFVHFMQILNENDGFNAEDLCGWVSSSLAWMLSSKWMYRVKTIFYTQFLSYLFGELLEVVIPLRFS